MVHGSFSRITDTCGVISFEFRALIKGIQIVASLSSRSFRFGFTQLLRIFIQVSLVELPPA